MLKVSEVYEKEVRNLVVRSDGSEYVNFEKTYSSRECIINPDYVVSVHSHEFTSSMDSARLEGVFPEDTKFSVLVLDGNSFRSSEMVVLGSFDKFCSVLGASPS